jgi:hypothetical protein
VIPVAIADEPVPPETVLCVGMATSSTVAPGHIVTGFRGVTEAPSWPGVVTSPESSARPRGVEVP